MEANQSLSGQGQKAAAYQRWYDKQQTVSKSVRLLENFPDQYREILAETMIRLSEKHCRANEIMTRLRDLSPEKVLSLFKAKDKQRWLDQNETVHHAMNVLYVLPEEERIFIATQVIEVTGYLLEYVIICERTNQLSQQEIIRGLCTAFVRGQLKNTAEYLSAFYPSMHLPNGPTLQSIRLQLSQSRANAYAEELTTFRALAEQSHEQNGLSEFGQSPAQLQNAHLKDSALLNGVNRTSPALQEAQAQPQTAASQTQPTTSAAEAQSENITPLQPAKAKLERDKDETVAQDNRGMKIKLDKFDF